MDLTFGIIFILEVSQSSMECGIARFAVNFPYWIFEIHACSIWMGQKLKHRFFESTFWKFDFLT